MALVDTGERPGLTHGGGAEFLPPAGPALKAGIRVRIDDPSQARARHSPGTRIACPG